MYYYRYRFCVWEEGGAWSCTANHLAGIIVFFNGNTWHRVENVHDNKRSRNCLRFPVCRMFNPRLALVRVGKCRALGSFFCVRWLCVQLFVSFWVLLWYSFVVFIFVVLFLGHSVTSFVGLASIWVGCWCPNRGRLHTLDTEF